MKKLLIATTIALVASAGFAAADISQHQLEAQQDVLPEISIAQQMDCSVADNACTDTVDGTVSFAYHSPDTETLNGLPTRTHGSEVMSLAKLVIPGGQVGGADLRIEVDDADVVATFDNGSSGFTLIYTASAPTTLMSPAGLQEMGTFYVADLDATGATHGDVFIVFS